MLFKPPARRAVSRGRPSASRPPQTGPSRWACCRTGSAFLVAQCSKFVDTPDHVSPCTPPIPLSYREYQKPARIADSYPPATRDFLQFLWATMLPRGSPGRAQIVGAAMAMRQQCHGRNRVSIDQDRVISAGCAAPRRTQTGKYSDDNEPANWSYQDAFRPNRISRFEKLGKMPRKRSDQIQSALQKSHSRQSRVILQRRPQCRALPKTIPGLWLNLSSRPVSVLKVLFVEMSQHRGNRRSDLVDSGQQLIVRYVEAIGPIVPLRRIVDVDHGCGRDTSLRGDDRSDCCKTDHRHGISRYRSCPNDALKPALTEGNGRVR